MFQPSTWVSNNQLHWLVSFYASHIILLKFFYQFWINTISPKLSLGGNVILTKIFDETIMKNEWHESS